MLVARQHCRDDRLTTCVGDWLGWCWLFVGLAVAATRRRTRSGVRQGWSGTAADESMADLQRGRVHRQRRVRYRSSDPHEAGTQPAPLCRRWVSWGWGAWVTGGMGAARVALTPPVSTKSVETEDVSVVRNETLSNLIRVELPVVAGQSAAGSMNWASRASVTSSVTNGTPADTPNALRLITPDAENP